MPWRRCCPPGPKPAWARPHMRSQLLDRAHVPRLDQLQVVAGGFEQTHQRRHAHVAFGEVLRALHGRARDTCSLGEFVLAQPRVAAGPLEHLGNNRKRRHCSPEASKTVYPANNVAQETQIFKSKVSMVTAHALFANVATTGLEVESFVKGENASSTEKSRSSSVLQRPVKDCSHWHSGRSTHRIAASGKSTPPIPPVLSIGSPFS